MVSLFGKKTSGWIGIDIGSSSVKLVSMSVNGNQYQIDAYAIVPLPASAVIDGNVEEVKEVTAAVQRGLKICGGKYNSAVVAVPSSAVITKRIQLSNLFTGIELEDQVKIEADQFIPYPLEEVALDFEVIGPASKDANLNDILLVACRKENADSREDSVNAAGVKCEVVDVDTYAMERVLALIDQAPGDQLVAVVDIGASTLCLNVFLKGKLAYNREQAFGGNDLSQAIHQQHGMSMEEVDLAFRENTLDQAIVDQMVVPFTDTVIQQVSRALQFFYSSGVHGQLGRVYICGGVSGLPNLTKRLSDELEVETQLLIPFNHTAVNRKLNPERLNRDGAVLAKACGLALRSFNQ
ncbi:pilus assembly protein PilM [Nitrincola sp. A-D6]|uniref:type IV pilus assembly protein PilM n=1 Tax=Nitrincola sp. A-D6 TaxID=1545442 RepID=UPI00051FAA67|nr:type IV pilus assembly protein PilM [Nitrincola sp. A-D6]KGK42869.1 pilus assembly protein PilM [Nitrincola sp. A-D6]